MAPRRTPNRPNIGLFSQTRAPRQRPKAVDSNRIQRACQTETGPVSTVDPDDTLSIYSNQWIRRLPESTTNPRSIPAFPGERVPINVSLRIRLLVATIAVVGGFSASSRAADLVGVDFMGMLYDVTETGQVTNPRSTGIDTLSGISFGPDGRLYGMDAATDFLWQINVASGASTPVGFTQLDVTEGGLSFDPVSGQLYAVQTFGDDRLFTIDTATGVGTPVGTIISGGDISALAFDDTGNLFALDTLNNAIYQIDPATAAILNTLPITDTQLGPSAGMVYDPVSGFFYLADGGPNSTNRFYLYFVEEEVLFPLADLTLPNGLSGLAYVPEPGCAVLLLVGGSLLLRRRR